MADRTPYEVADALEAQTIKYDGKGADKGFVYLSDIFDAAVLLRWQGEQLDTLRDERDALLEAIGNPELLRLDADKLWNHSHRDAGLNPQIRVLNRIADAVDALAAAAVPQDPEEG